MKRWFFGAVCCLSAVCASAGNLLKNGSFEEVNSAGFPKDWYVFDAGKGGWKQQNIVIQSEPNIVLKGNRAASMIHAASGYSSWVMLRQDIKKFEPGKYVFTGNVYWTRKSLARPCVTLHLIDRKGGVNHPLVFRIWNKSAPEGWVPFRYEFTVDSNVRVIGVNAIATDGPAQVYVDDLGIWKAEDAPPAPVKPRENPPVIPRTTGHPVVNTASPGGHVAVGKIHDRWYMISPEGKCFWDLGVNHCSYPAKNSWWDRLAPQRGIEVRKKYPDPAEWERQTAVRLRYWGFTSLGAWSYSDILKEAEKQGLYFWVALGISDKGRKKHYLRNSSGTPVPVGGTSRMADPFDPEWRAEVDAAVRKTVASLGNSPAVLGFFPDNEISLGVVPLCGYIGSPHTAKALAEWLERRYDSKIEVLNRAWNTGYGNFAEIAVSPPDYAAASDGTKLVRDLEAFEDFIVETYVDFSIGVIRKYAPHALIASPRLPGARFADYGPLRHFSKYDIVAVNCYGGKNYRNEQLENLRRIHRVTGRPVIITEWTVGATDRNHSGVAATQAERAAIYQDMVRQISNEPYMVGMHFQMWFSPEAIGGNQFGIVDSSEEPFDGFTEAVGRFQRESWR